jgi:hypothetical protein
MATIGELETALRNADAAGANDDARLLAAEIVKMRGTAPSGNKTWTDSAVDFAKSIPGGIASGLSGFNTAARFITGANEDTSYDPIGDAAGRAFKGATENLPKPRGVAGKFGAALGEGIGNPLAYAGPGGAMLKVGGAVLSSTGSEAAGQATEGTAYEAPARIVGALAGGVAAAKGLWPKAPKAAAPNYQELKTEANRLYTEARNSGVEFNPQGVSQFATRTEQELAGANYGFTGGADGVAPQTFAVLQRLQNPPPGASISASNVDALRKNLGMLARQTAEGKPTPDAAAASIALSKLNSYLEAPPAGHVVAGDAGLYVRATKQANANYAAGQRVRDWQTRLDNAELDASGQIAGSLENRQKIAARQILKSPNILNLSSTSTSSNLQRFFSFFCSAKKIFKLLPNTTLVEVVI